MERLQYSLLNLQYPDPVPGAMSPVNPLRLKLMQLYINTEYNASCITPSNTVTANVAIARLKCAMLKI